MQYYIKYVIALYILNTTAGFTPTFSSSPEKPANELLYFAGGNFLYNKRIGTYIFESIKTRQDIVQPRLSLFGFNFGRRYYASSWLRFQITGMFNFGSSIEDSLSFNDVNFSPKYLFKHLGCDVDIHLVRPRSNKLAFFVLCGGGINRMHTEEHTVLEEDHTQEVTVPGYSAIYLKYWNPSFHFGAGFDIRITKNFGITVSYSYRIWQPVKYLDARDLPLEAIEYKEMFYTHMLQTKLLLNLLGE